MRICFVSMSAFPIVSNSADPVVGGAEVQQHLLAQELQRRGIDVVFVTGDYGQKDIVHTNGFCVYKIPNKWPHMTIVEMLRCYRVLEHLNADVYYQRGASVLTGPIGLFCKTHQKRFLFSMSSDAHCFRSYKPAGSIFYQLSYQLGLKLADNILAQHALQANLIKEDFGYSADVVPSMVRKRQDSIVKCETPFVIWVASMYRYKAPEIYVRLAAELPKIKFIMIGGPALKGYDYYEEVRKMAEQYPNLQFLGFVPHHQLSAYYEKASLLVNTTPKSLTSEGFPSSFLEAWSNETPVVSLHCDPSGIMTRYEIGVLSGNEQQLKTDVRLLMTQHTVRSAMGKRAREYVAAEHCPAKVTAKFLSLLT